MTFSKLGVTRHPVRPQYRIPFGQLRNRNAIPLGKQPAVVAVDGPVTHAATVAHDSPDTMVCHRSQSVGCPQCVAVGLAMVVVAVMLPDPDTAMQYA